MCLKITITQPVYIPHLVGIGKTCQLTSQSSKYAREEAQATKSAKLHVLNMSSISCNKNISITDKDMMISIAYQLTMEQFLCVYGHSAKNIKAELGSARR